MKEPSDFYTLKGYERTNHSHITSSMEDYLEMICRMRAQNETVRINTLAGLLNVRPSSASKMITNLKNAGLVDFQPYGYIQPTDKGNELGQYLLYRHHLLNEFLCLINHTDNELEQVEKIEHFINEKTLKNIELFLASQ